MRKIIAMVVLFSMLLNVSIYGGTNFGDVPDGAWYEEHVVKLVGEKIISGYPDGTFKPNNEITVDQFVKTMIVALGYELPLGDSYWASTYMEKARELNLIDDTEFQSQISSSAAINRGQMAKICENTIVLLEGTQTYTMTSDVEQAVSDRREIIASGLSEYIYHMYELGVILGYPDKAFKAENTLSRAEAVTVVRRVIDESVRSPFVKYEGAYIADGIEDGEYVEFSIILDVLNPLELQYTQTEEFLIEKVGNSLANEIMEYVKTKEHYKDEIFKIFSWGSKSIMVKSSWGENNITILGD